MFERANALTERSICLDIVRFVADLGDALRPALVVRRKKVVSPSGCVAGRDRHDLADRSTGARKGGVRLPNLVRFGPM